MASPFIQLSKNTYFYWVICYYYAVIRGRNKPKLPLVRRISDMLKTTCPPTCPLVQVLVHFVGPKEIILVLQPFLIYHNENIIIYCTAHIKYSIHTCA